jgi:hypothetical protein
MAYRLVEDRHIVGRSVEASALYLFLVTVTDGQGLSYYSDAGVGKLLPLDALILTPDADVHSVRNGLDFP